MMRPGDDRPLIILAPHPDDELLGAGALLREAVAAGRRTAVLLLTDGAASHADIADLADRRLAELRRGLEVLTADQGAGAIPSLALGAPDGRLEEGEVLTQAAAAVATLGAGRDAVLVATDPGDAHPDHQAGFRLGVRLVLDGAAAALATMPVSQRLDPVGRGEAEPASDGWTERPLTNGARAAKARAIACHVSQVVDAGTGFHLSPAMIAPFLAAERFAPVVDRRSEGDDAVPPAHFDALFAADPDPWRYASDPLEAERRDATVALATAGGPGLSILELGCANGAMTAELAPHARRLVAVDAAPAALALARDRVGGEAGVEWVTGRAPAVMDTLPTGGFDRVLLSDMLYYLGFDGVVATARGAARVTAPGGRIILAAYRGPTECALSGPRALHVARAALPDWCICARADTVLAEIIALERA